MDEIVIRRPNDFHLHLRSGELLKEVLFFSARQFDWAVVMPNTRPQPILTGADARRYYQEIIDAAQSLDCAGFPSFKPLMTIQITPNTAPETIKRAAESGTLIGKIYPLGITTNSDNGVLNFQKLYPVFEEMQKLDMVLSLHGESPDNSTQGIEREEVFLHTLRTLVRYFPRLRIVLEHITTRAAVECISTMSAKVAATITAHHLLLTLDDVIGYSPESRGLMQPHNFCKPIAKTVYDRSALRTAVRNGNPKFFFGSDSAPHPKENKECAFCCAGVFTSPVALPLLAQLLEYLGCLERLQGFVSDFGARFYRRPPNEGTLRLVKKRVAGPLTMRIGRSIYGRPEHFLASQRLTINQKPAGNRAGFILYIIFYILLF